ncbi:hypothetical protein Hanom_Chr04g00314131 [Helianthus anomalus]
MYCKNLFFSFLQTYTHRQHMVTLRTLPSQNKIHAQQQTPFDFPFSLVTHVTGDHDSGSGGIGCRRPSTDATHPHTPFVPRSDGTPTEPPPRFILYPPHTPLLL